ncbi:uncharacterized protein LOC106150397 isoform X2 [Lingula anatina]|uniref:Uncharacterized protein LOC106150397 isoform X2 n=1 Tax=Lingula anatina TaxID=7574 RepID=A0A1S3GXN6_LINAN|nr:uncharacterized protein LOC106150397 isoform X2 [Lingula anatina]|eukprot:XP_013378625.1 uncharacterized protein LOC106150397 isoform X2 [Lingula anatina]
MLTTHSTMEVLWRNMVTQVIWWRWLGLLTVLLSLGGAMMDLVRFEDKPFDTSILVHGRTVSCNGSIPKGRFAGPTWTCADIKVDGLRLSYGFISYESGVGQSERHCDANTDNLTNDYAQLCREMMAVQKDVGREPFWSAFISDGSCGALPEKRMRFLKDRGRVWHVMDPGRGYVRTLQCMLYPNPNDGLH